MLLDIFLALWIFLPAGIANTTPIVAAKAPLLERWDYPMDFGVTLNGVRLLGSHKTWRGIISGTLAGTLVFALQQAITPGDTSFAQALSDMGYYDQSLWFGLLLGLGALLGDAVKSFFKRFRKIPEGRHWFPFDQLDYIVGGCLLASLAWVLPLELYGWIVLLWFGMHLLFSYIGYRLHLKDAPI